MFGSRLYLSQQQQQRNSQLLTWLDSVLGDKKTNWQHSGGLGPPFLRFLFTFWLNLAPAGTTSPGDFSEATNQLETAQTHTLIPVDNHQPCKPTFTRLFFVYPDHKNTGYTTSMSMTHPSGQSDGHTTPTLPPMPCKGRFTGLFFFCF